MTTEEPVTGQTHNLELHETVTFSDQVFAQHSVPTLAALVDASTDVIKNRPDESFIYRGQSSKHPLATSLERACLRAHGDLTHAKNREHALIREFKRRYHHYGLHLPADDHDI